MKIKVCGMRDAKNIAQLCLLPIDYIGFIFYAKSPRYAEKLLERRTMLSIPRHIQKTGVFVNADLEYIAEMEEYFVLDAVQLHGSESPQMCADVRDTGKTVIKAFGVGAGFDFAQLDAYESLVDYFLFDTKSDAHGGTGRKFDWEMLRAYHNRVPIFLSGGIGEDDAQAIKDLSWLNIAALDLNSRFETEPAMKDIELLEGFIKRVK